MFTLKNISVMYVFLHIVTKLCITERTFLTPFIIIDIKYYSVSVTWALKLDDQMS